jgi:hypothetical protein
MGPLADRPFLHRSIGAFVAMVAVALLALVASAAIQPRVDNPHGKFKGECQMCHSAKGWKAVKVSSKFDHSKSGFALAGAHATANCMGCHTSLNFAQSKTQCASCHQDPHRSEMGPNCARCHGSRSFQDRGPMVRAHQLTRFPLTGSHATIECEGCHKPAAQGKMQFVGTSAECYSCHKPQYETAPGHKSGSYSTQCQTCHTPTTWGNVNGFDHGAAGFPLTGSHVQPCANCHHGVFANMSKDCYSCHATTYAGATPPHNPTSFPTATANCTGCHQQAAANHITWAGAVNYDHTAAGFPLTGNHSTTVRQCDDCHHGNYVTMSKDCASCHTTSTPGYNNPGPGAPAHNATNFPAALCASCHASAAATHTSWAGATYTHQQMQLTNAHSGRLCDDCHKGNYTTVTFNCYGCHQNSVPGYANAANPTHSPAGFPTTNAACMGCHNTIAWRPASFTHTATFPLSNSHAGRLCEDCHKGNYATLVNNCYGCHQNSVPGYANAANPPHSPTAFPTTNTACTGCHTTIAFTPSTFKHSSTPFPLTGAHLAQPCTACHNAATWAVQGTGNNCYGCHQNSTPGYATAVPPHTPTNYPIAGCVCHNTTTWLGATSFDHTTVGFPLTGAHSLAQRQCVDCHSVIGYTAQSTDKDCITCHATAYNANVVVKHTAPNFPSTTTACITCHVAANTSHVTWSNGVFTNHAGVTTGLALSGNHGGRLCSDCHVAATTDLKQWTCAASCHTGSPGFQGHANKSCAGTAGFNAVKATGTMKACYTCHPRGTSSSPC